MVKNFTFVTFLVCINSFCLAQNILEGKIIDNQTKEPLPFVNVIINNNPQKGACSDIDGTFYFKANELINNLSFSYVGYFDTTISHQQFINSNNTIRLRPKFIDIKEVIVYPTENPALQILRKVIQNKEINNPENLQSFRCKTYNKAVYDFVPHDTVKQDSSKINKLLKGGHLLISESVTEKIYKWPDNHKETVLGTKMSGFLNPSVAILSTDIQPFTFYNDYITVFDKEYLNPISKGSFSRYKFKIEDTIYHTIDTTYIISFYPQENKNFNALSGVLYINTYKYALQNVIGKPAEASLVDVKIQQQYSLIDDSIWFPSQLNYEVILKEYPSKSTGMRLIGKSYIDSVKVNSSLTRNNFGIERLSINNDAAIQPKEFWIDNRTDNLNVSEEITYRNIDSLGKKLKFDAKLKLMEKFLLGKIPVGFIDFDINESFIYNKFEGYRLGLGIQTNEKLLKRISFGGSGGYGLNDKKWKYSCFIVSDVLPEYDFKLSIRYFDNLKETGIPNFKPFAPVFTFREYLGYRYDNMVGYSFQARFRTLKYANVAFEINKSDITQCYEEPFYSQGYTNSNISLKLRYAFKEKLISAYSNRFSMGSRYPIFYFSYIKGFANLFNGDINYDRIDLQAEDSYTIRNFGKTSVTVSAGYIKGTVPYGILFSGEGSFDNELPVFCKNTFQTVSPYEFLSDSYAHLFLIHNFGSLLFKTKWLAPDISILQNIGVGYLSNNNDYSDLYKSTMEKGLFESGIQIDKIIKLKYLNLFYIGFGGGIYCRYGTYSGSSISNNLAVKFSFTVSTF